MFVPAPLSAHPQSQAQPPPQPLSLDMAGEIANAGRHSYDSEGGQALFVSVMGQVLNLTTTRLSYKVDAEEAGLKVTGDASISLSGQTTSGQNVSIRGSMSLSKGTPVPAESFPVGCSTNCTSDIVAFYTGTAHLDFWVGNAHKQAWVPLSFESAFLNPFGKPIIIASLDNGTTLTVVTTYTSANIRWAGVLIKGTLSGTLNGAPVTGQFGSTANAKDENLLAGTETESGAMVFSGMSVPSLDVSGTYNGTSIIPTTGTIDCSALTGIPGTCTETGFASRGPSR